MNSISFGIACEFLINFIQRALDKQHFQIIETLICAGRDKNKHVRYMAYKSILEIMLHIPPEKIPEIIESLLSGCNDKENKIVRLMAYQALDSLAEKVSDNQHTQIFYAILNIHKNQKDIMIFDTAIETLRKYAMTMPYKKKIAMLPGLFRQYENYMDDIKRWEACLIIGSFAEAEPNIKIINFLYYCCNDRDESVRHIACLSLSKIAKVSSKYGDEIIDYLFKIPYAAYGTLQNIIDCTSPEGTTQIVDKFLALCKYKDKYIRSLAYQALVKLVVNTRFLCTSQIVDTLLAGCVDKDKCVFHFAYMALGKIEIIEIS